MEHISKIHDKLTLRQQQLQDEHLKRLHASIKQIAFCHFEVGIMNIYVHEI